MVVKTKEYLKKPWKEPNNGRSFFKINKNKDKLRDLYNLRQSDPEKAFAGFLQLAEDGSVWSMRQVGSSLLRGLGTQVNRHEAKKWLMRGYEAGDESAMLELANEFIRDGCFADAEAILAQAVAAHLPAALYLQGLLLLKAKQKHQAAAMLEKAATHGHRQAKWLFCMSCLKGHFGIRLIPRGFKLLDEIRDEVEREENI